ncbi:MAG: protease modulator HflC [Rudaea sp.]|uniref:protease modulator HflC n=1 Tax=Rudaea sp. TaxID=2136325 RepID=UPI0039E6D996
MKLFVPALALLIVVLAVNSAFVVKEGESALVTQFGRIQGDGGAASPDYGPGLHFKLPLIQNVVRFDRRMLNLEAKPERYFDSGKNPVNVDFYVKWRIENPALYYRSFGADSLQNQANSRLTPIIKDPLRFEFNSHTLSDLIASARSDITERVRDQANRAAAGLGIHVVDVRIKRIEFPDEVLESVYKRMSSERKRLANDLRFTGDEQAAKIKADADRQVQVIKAEAERDAQTKRGEGDARASAAYAAAYGKNPDFYALYRSLDAYRNAFGSGDVIVLDPKSEFMKYFGESKGEGGK